MAIQLYKFGSVWGIADASPFCIKVESFLRLAKASFDVVPFDVKNLKGAPKGKMPYIALDGGELVADSSLIIERLTKVLKFDLDEKLSVEQKAISHAYIRMLDEATYWPLLFSRWSDEKGWGVIAPIFFHAVPVFLRPLVEFSSRRDMLKSMSGQGINRHSGEEIYEFARKDFQALADFLGENNFFFGAERPALLDITVHAFVANIIEPPIDTVMKRELLEMQNLCDHSRRIQEIIYG